MKLETEAPVFDKTSAETFFRCLFPDLQGEFIERRCMIGRNVTDQTYYPSVDSFITDWEMTSQRASRENIYFGVCARSERKGSKDVVRCLRCLYVDLDFKTFLGGELEAREQLGKFLLKPTIIVQSGHGLHLYWVLKSKQTISGPSDIVRLESYLKGIATALKGDMASAELARVLRIPGTLNHKDAEAVPVTIEMMDVELQYELSNFDSFIIKTAYANIPRKPYGWVADAFSGLDIESHNRNTTFTSIAGKLHREHWSNEEILSLLSPHASQYQFDYEELKGIVESISRYPTPVISVNTLNPFSKKKKKWPEDLASEAFHGLAGEVVNTILPQTEADPAALLLNFLVAFSSVIDRGPHFVVSGAKNHLNIFGVVVGDTATARKGVSWGSIREIFKAHDPEWSRNNLASGLSSGEGLIWRVRDAIFKLDKSKENSLSLQKEIEIDPGIADKRLLVVENEFSRVLKNTFRKDNILSDVIRDAYDSGTISTLTKCPYKTTDASIAILGFITPQELLRKLGDSETANGFANRFLWMVVKMSKSLPDGGNLSALVIHQLADKLRRAVDFSRTVGEMKRDSEATELWKQVYSVLGRPKIGLFGDIAARGQSLVARISCLYALLDHSSCVKLEHLSAALAVWDRAEGSIKYIFGEKTGDPIADSILSALESQGKMDQTDIYNLFGGNKRADRISNALSELSESGLIMPQRDTETGGRPRTLWSLSSTCHATE